MRCPELRLPTADPQPFATLETRHDHHRYRPSQGHAHRGRAEPRWAILATIRLPVDPATLSQLLRFADNWAQRQWLVEGAAGVGLGMAQRLMAHGQEVVDVPATLAA